MNIKVTNFDSVLSDAKENDGIVLLGCGGELTDWVDGVTEILYDKGISKSKNPSDVWDRAEVIETTDGRIDLVLFFKRDHGLDIGKMAIWRLQFGGCSWVSDYVVNYSQQHEDKELIV